VTGSGAPSRPAGFRTVDHPVAAAAVLRAVRAGRPPHALMLVGPPRVGKTTLALDLAAGLLCLDADPTARPCGACSACRKVGNGNHPDLHRLAPEGAGAQVRLDLIHADRRARLAAVRSLQEDASELAALLAAPPEGRSAVTGAGPDDERPGGDSPAETSPDDAAPAPADTSRRTLAPAARRQGATMLLAIWRDLARDLAVAAHGGRAELRRTDLLDELEPVARQLHPATVATFLARLDGAAAAVEAYANPDLVLDVLTLAWPRAVRVA
jgi:hypothetical protein